MCKIKMYLDFDSTITDSIARFIELANKMYNTNRKPCELGDFNFKSLYPDITKKEVYEIFNSKEFFDGNLKFMENCKEVLHKYQDSLDITVVTASSGDNLKFKTEWINNNLPFVSNIIATKDTNKSVVDMRNGIQIDDICECLEYTNAKVKILLRDNCNYEWQRHNNDDIYDVNSWSDIGEMLEYYIKQGVN